MFAVGVLLVTTLGACGFNDTLTSRGFIKEGDQICIDTLVKARVGLHAQANVSRSEFLSTLASAYGAAAARFRRLDIRSDDDAIRDRIVSGYASFSRRLRTAAEASLVSATAQAQAVYVDAAALQHSLKSYGFLVCGGGGNPQ